MAPKSYNFEFTDKKKTNRKLFLLEPVLIGILESNTFALCKKNWKDVSYQGKVQTHLTDKAGYFIVYKQ